MHVVQMALSTVGIMLGGAAATTGTILANVPAISESTPITLALTFGGVGMAAALTWKVAGAWGRIEHRLGLIEERLLDLKHKLEDERQHNRNQEERARHRQEMDDKSKQMNDRGGSS